MGLLGVTRRSSFFKSSKVLEAESHQLQPRYFISRGVFVVCEIVANTPSLPLNFSTHIIYIYNSLILQFRTNRVCNVCPGESDPGIQWFPRSLPYRLVETCIWVYTILKTVQ